MTPGARVAAAIAVLDAIDAGQPAEQALTNWARGARFAGSKDRAAIRDHVFQALRCRRSYAALGGAGTGRGLMIGALRADGVRPADLFTGAGYAPAPLTDEEAAAGADPVVRGARLDLPDWILPHLDRALPEADRLERTARLLRQRAPVMLRVNRRKATRDEALAALAEDGIGAAPAAIAPLALRVTANARRVAQSAAYRSGLVELQDGASQAAMDLIDLPEGGRVLDYCAGGGGKTLALAARAEARWFAHDADPRRMKDLPARAARAGIEVTRLEGERLYAEPFDLVLCDVPCSGTGTWRRTPDAKWRFGTADLDALLRIQAEILDRAQALVGAGGQLAYATCSLLSEENEAQIAGFRQRHPGWAVTDARRFDLCDEGDGFYIAVLSRV